jgi:hypothetical protein
MYPDAEGGGERAKVAPFAQLARGSWQDARSLVIKRLAAGSELNCDEF